MDIKKTLLNLNAKNLFVNPEPNDGYRTERNEFVSWILSIQVTLSLCEQLLMF
jgi:hypothetical protein